MATMNTQNNGFNDNSNEAKPTRSTRAQDWGISSSNQTGFKQRMTNSRIKKNAYTKQELLQIFRPVEALPEGFAVWTAVMSTKPLDPENKSQFKIEKDAIINPEFKPTGRGRGLILPRGRGRGVRGGMTRGIGRGRGVFGRGERFGDDRLGEISEEKKITGNYDDSSLWVYKGDGGAVKGPYSLAKLKEWVEASFFDSSIGVKRHPAVEEEDFVPLREVLEVQQLVNKHREYSDDMDEKHVDDTHLKSVLDVIDNEEEEDIHVQRNEIHDVPAGIAQQWAQPPFAQQPKFDFRQPSPVQQIPPYFGQQIMQDPQQRMLESLLRAPPVQPSPPMGFGGFTGLDHPMSPSQLFPPQNWQPAIPQPISAAQLEQQLEQALLTEAQTWGPAPIHPQPQHVVSPVQPQAVGHPGQLPKPQPQPQPTPAQTAPAKPQPQQAAPQKTQKAPQPQSQPKTSAKQPAKAQPKQTPKPAAVQIPKAAIQQKAQPISSSAWNVNQDTEEDQEEDDIPLPPPPKQTQHVEVEVDDFSDDDDEEDEEIPAKPVQQAKPKTTPSSSKLIIPPQPKLVHIVTKPQLPQQPVVQQQKPKQPQSTVVVAGDDEEEEDDRIYKGSSTSLSQYIPQMPASSQPVWGTAKQPSPTTSGMSVKEIMEAQSKQSKKIKKTEDKKKKEEIAEALAKPTAWGVAPVVPQQPLSIAEIAREEAKKSKEQKPAKTTASVISAASWGSASSTPQKTIAEIKEEEKKKTQQKQAPAKATANQKQPAKQEPAKPQQKVAPAKPAQQPAKQNKSETELFWDYEEEEAPKAFTQIERQVAAAESDEEEEEEAPKAGNAKKVSKKEAKGAKHSYAAALHVQGKATNQDLFDNAEFPSLAAIAKPAPKKQTIPAPVPTKGGSSPFGVEASMNFKEWYKKQLQALGKKYEQSLMNFLVSLQSDEEIESYIIEYLGNTAPVRKFADEFKRYKSFETSGAGRSQQNKKKSKKGQVLEL